MPTGGFFFALLSLALIRASSLPSRQVFAVSRSRSARVGVGAIVGSIAGSCGAAVTVTAALLCAGRSSLVTRCDLTGVAARRAGGDRARCCSEDRRAVLAPVEGEVFCGAM